MTTPERRSEPRAVYDATADAYVAAIGTRLNPAFEGPIDRALLGAFAELAEGAWLPVADLGCGPGRVAAHLVDRRFRTLGLDLSESMVRNGRGAHPGVPFGVGDLRHLPLADSTLGGAVCWYAVIHSAPEELPVVFGEVARVLAGGAPLLVAFQTGDDERLERQDAHGSGLPLTSFRHHVDTVADSLGSAGFDTISRTVRQPMSAAETTQQAYLLAIAG